MWTSEFETDHTVVTILDDDGKNEDVTIHLYADFVDLTQWNETLQRYDLISISTKQFYEIFESLKHPEGMFQSDIYLDDIKKA